MLLPLKLSCSDTHLDVAGTLSSAGERRNRLGDAPRVLKDVDYRGQVALVGFYHQGRRQRRQHHDGHGRQPEVVEKLYSLLQPIVNDHEVTLRLE